jgi:HEAT repeat protein
MARRDEGSVCLRRKAVFLISQHEGKEAETMLLEAVRSDPDREVREQGVFWLSQVQTEAAVAALDSVLRASQDQAIQEKAIFALSQHNSPRAQRALQDYARRTTAPLALRENAVFWLGQSSRADNGEFLRTLYGSVSESSLKEKVIFSLAQRGNREDARWLLQIAANDSENVEIRKKAVFWAAQSGGIDLPELFTLYDQARDRELKEQLIFAYSQSSHKGAVDKLIDIAKTDSDRELRKKALFWLTQTKDPRVPQLIADIIDKP